MMLFLALTYLLYAMNAPMVRDAIGLPTTGVNTTLDTVQPVTAMCIVLLSAIKVIW